MVVKSKKAVKRGEKGVKKAFFQTVVGRKIKKLVLQPLPPKISAQPRLKIRRQWLSEQKIEGI